MLDLNHRSPGERIRVLIDAALQKERSGQKPRNYLGGSRLGHPCARALQFEYFNTSKDAGREFSGQTLRIFEAGHHFEDMAARWLKLAGFELLTTNKRGEQFGFSVAGGRIRGHIDGVIVGGPSLIGFPALWENKSMNREEFNKTAKQGVATAHPEYAAQIAIYQAYMDLTEDPALFTFVNKDTQDIEFELVAFNPELAQASSDKGVKILQACDAGEPFPRIARNPDYYLCKWCAWSDRCWQLNA